MKLNYDSYNDNNQFGATLEPLDLNLNRDIEEMSLPSDYTPSIPEEDEDDEDED